MECFFLFSRPPSVTLPDKWFSRKLLVGMEKSWQMSVTVDRLFYADVSQLLTAVSTIDAK